MFSQHHFTDLNKLPISIRLGSYTGEFLYWGYFPAEYWRNYWHLHSFFEVCYAFQGSGLFRIHSQEFPIAAGDLFIARPGEPHEIISSLTDPLGIYFWSYTLLPTARAESGAEAEAEPTRHRSIEERFPDLFPLDIRRALCEDTELRRSGEELRAALGRN